MKAAFTTLTLAASASAAAVLPRDAGCCFGLTASGGVSGSVSQLSDGQNRVGGASSSGNAARYCLSNGGITDASGRGCILTAPTTQFQCDSGASPTTGFSVSSSGNIAYNGNTQFVACPVNDNGEYNIYTTAPSGQGGCESITLSTGGACSASSSSSASSLASSAPASSAPASSASKPASSAPASSAPASSAPASLAPASSAPASSASEPASSAPASSAPASSAPASSAPATSVPAPQSSVSMVTSCTTYAVTHYAPAPSAPASSAPASPAPASSAPASSAPASSASKSSAPASSTPQSSAPASSASKPSASASSAPASSAASTPVVPATGYGSSTAPASSAKASSSAPASSAPASSAPVNSAPSSSAPVSSAAVTSAPAPSSSAATKASGTASASGSACATTLQSGAYQTPHLIVPVNKNSPSTSYGTSYDASINQDNSTIFQFDIPESYSGKQCTLVFLWPEESQLETSSFTTSGSGGITFGQCTTETTSATTYASAGQCKTIDTISNAAPGNSYVITTGACAAGQSVSYEASATGSLSLSFFEDWNPSPIGAFITTC